MSIQGGVQECRERIFPTLSYQLEKLKGIIREFCREYRLEDLSDLKYHTLAVSVVAYKRNRKSYRRVQLKAYYTKEGVQKTKTLMSWKEGEEPKGVGKFVYLYRSTKHLQKSLENLFPFITSP